MECTHETIGCFSCHTEKATVIEKTSWMMHHDLLMLCGLDGKVRNGMEKCGWSGVGIVDSHQEDSG